MSSMEKPLTLVPELSKAIPDRDDFKIYTHSAKTRTIIMVMFVSYLTFFFFFVSFLKTELEDLQNVPQALAGMQDTELSYVVFYILSGIGMLFAMLLLLYFTWAVADIWGLQVLVNPRELRIQNTVTGSLFAKWMGLGSMRMEDIETLKGTRFATHVINGDKDLRFSPVDQVDALIADIMANAKNARIQS